MELITAHLKCACHDSAHFVELEVSPEDMADVPLAWLQVADGETTLWDRLRSAWEIIIYGRATTHWLALDAKALHEFREYIDRVDELVDRRGTPA